MPKLTGFVNIAMTSILRVERTALRGVQNMMVSAHGIFPKTSGGRGHGLDATPRNVAKLLMGWICLGTSRDPSFRDRFLDLELAELAENADESFVLFGKRLETFISDSQLARTVLWITIFPALGSAKVEYAGGNVEQFGRGLAQHDGPQRAMLLPGSVIIQIADALHELNEQFADGDELASMEFIDE